MNEIVRQKQTATTQTYHRLNRARAPDDSVNVGFGTFLRGMVRVTASPLPTEYAIETHTPRFFPKDRSLAAQWRHGRANEYSRAPSAPNRARITVMFTECPHVLLNRAILSMRACSACRRCVCTPWSPAPRATTVHGPAFPLAFFNTTFYPGFYALGKGAQCTRLDFSERGEHLGRHLGRLFGISGPENSHGTFCVNPRDS